MTNTNTQSILLLTSYFSKSAKDSAKPLTPTEWGRFAQWLNEQGKKPSDLVTTDPRAVLHGWADSKIPLERIEQLLNRGHALALALEKWSRAGIWVLTRSDADYPRLLKQHLRTYAPPVLFGCGNVQLLNRKGVGVVGSRKANDADLNYAQELGKRIVEAGYSVVSGGARGIDETAMVAGLSNDGTVIGMMADSLLGAATASKWRQGLMNNNLVLVSPFYPEAGFNKGNAMARNKYIYCLSQAAVVVHSGSSGGTWTGALENLKKSWVPLWVKPTEDADAGNLALVTQGGQWLEGSAGQLDVEALLMPGIIDTLPGDLLADAAAFEEERPDLSIVTQHIGDCVSEPLPASENQIMQHSVEKSDVLAELGFYQFFLQKMQHFDSPVTIGEMVEKWTLPEKLLKAWLKQSVEEGQVRKLTKPVRYQFITANQLGLSLE